MVGLVTRSRDVYRYKKLPLHSGTAAQPLGSTCPRRRNCRQGGGGRGEGEGGKGEETKEACGGGEAGGTMGGGMGVS